MNHSRKEQNHIEITPAQYPELCWNEFESQRGTVQIEGPPGVGKNALATQYALEWLPAHVGESTGLIHVNCGNEESYMPRGVMMPRLIPEESYLSEDLDPESRRILAEMMAPFSRGGKLLTMMNAQPAWHTHLAELVSRGVRWVVFLVDEVDKAKRDTLLPYIQLMFEQVIGEASVPHQVHLQVIANANRVQDRSGSTGASNFAHQSGRITRVTLRMPPSAWCAWAASQRLHWSTIAFAERQPAVVFESPPTSDGTQYCTPRTMTAADRALQYFAHRREGSPLAFSHPLGRSKPWQTSEQYAEEKSQRPAPPEPIHALPLDPLARAIVGGHIGALAADQFFAFANLAKETASLREIVASPTTARVPSEHRIDAVVAQQQILLSDLTRQTIGPVLAYARRLPAFQLRTFMEQFIERVNPSENLLQTHAWETFRDDNAQALGEQFGFDNGLDSGNPSDGWVL